MIPALLVEDDIEMLTALTRMIRWEEFGFRIVGTAADGEEGLDLIRRHEPGLVVTDISMPRLDGLSMIRTAREEGFNFKAAILTCHEDFEYARTSINLDVLDYIVKITLTEEDLAATAEKAARQLADDRDPSRSFRTQERLFAQVLDGQLSHEELAAGLRRERLPTPPESYLPLQLFIDNYAADIHRSSIRHPYELKCSVLQAVHDLEERGLAVLLVSSADDQFSFIVWSKTERPADLIAELLDEEICSLGERERVSLTAVLAPAVTSLAQADGALRSALKWRHELFLREGSGLIRTDRGRRRFKYRQCDRQELAAPLEASLRRLDEADSAGEVDRLVGHVAQQDYDPEELVLLFDELEAAVENAARRLGLPHAPAPRSADRLRAAAEILHDSVGSFFRAARERGKLSAREEINRTINHIRENMHTGISCSDMAALANMSVSHFSRVFRQETGMSFSRFLTDVRVRRADELLLDSDVPIEQVAAAVGFDNPSYFYRVYKRETGLTPGERRR